MATAPLSNSPSRLFDVYTDNAPNHNLSPMPRGGCNFVDLTPGTAGSRCGCRRFWKLHAADNGQAGWCMCNHHACYHDDRAADEALAPPPPTPVPGQENEKPKPTGREPLSPVVDFSFKVPPAIPGLDMANLSSGPPPLSFLNDFSHDTEMMNAPNVAPNAAPSLPDTLNNWGEFVHSDYEQCALPPIPPQCLMSQKTASTTSSVQNRYLRPFAGRGLHTLSGAKEPKQSPLRQTSRSKSQATQGAPVHAQHPTGTPMTGVSTIAEPRALDRNVASNDGLRNLTDTLSGHEQRLDKLETGSFTAATAHDDCVDKHEHLDLRITDLEGKVEELEKFTNDNDTVVSRRERHDDDGATASIISVTTSTTNRPAHARDLANQLQALQSQVSQLQSFIPSINHPWEVEVVFLPFPLKKVWQELQQFKHDPTLSNDDWTQVPQTNSASMFRSQSPVFGDWATPDHDAEWLLPKACGDKSVTDKRLRSRGLVKTISVHGPDARSVHVAVVAAFASVFAEMQMPPRRQDADPRYAHCYMGLQSTWLPLRKIHRDSRLRFLSPAEMVTPALWDVQFLSSIMMRSSEPRLFITHPDAYLQDYAAYEAGWTWQRVRELTRVYPDFDDSQQVPEADACEEHWSWSETMDEPPNVHTSMSLRQSRQRATASPSHARFPLIERWRSQSPAVIREHSPLVNNSGRSAGPRSSSRPPHGRTASVPVAAGSRHPSVDNYQRRVSTNSRRASPAMRVSVSGGGIMKNGRGTRSPSHPLYTPRWTHSPSPMPWGGPQDRQTARGMTPFAYATPHSNATAPPPQQQQENGYRARSGSVVRFEVHQPYYQQRHRSSSSRRTAVPPPTTMLIDDDDDNANNHVRVYNSASDEDYEDEEDDNTDSVDMVTDAQPHPLQALAAAGGSGWPGMPEDEPWPGIEDGAPRSGDAENIDPNVSLGGASQQSSQPSEYPSTQLIKRDEDEDDDFLIHED